jgi:OmpA-OmpF porin, OOP family
MKTKIAIISLTLILLACSKEDASDKSAAGINPDSTAASGAPAEVMPDTPGAAEPANPAEVPTEALKETMPNLKAELDWNTIPDLKDIGNFPFFSAPDGFKIEDEKDGLSEFFDYEKLENYTGSGVYTTEGKMGVLIFEEYKDDRLNQRLFDKNVADYLQKIGAKEIYKGDYPANETKNEDLRKKLNENMWSGKHRTTGINSGEPLAVYAFKNNGKHYMVNVQSNSAQANIYIMELQAFVPTMKKYTAEAMKAEIDATGKAILNINFDTDKATLKPDGVDVVKQITALLKNNADLKLSIEGHTDNTGAAARNMTLSNERANAVMQALVVAGANKDNLKAAGFGADKPLVSNDSDENKGKNRRVELVKF